MLVFGYEAFKALKAALILFLYDKGDLLPLDQPNGVANLERLLTLFEAEADSIVLNHRQNKIELYITELEARAFALNLAFGDLFSEMMFFPESKKIVNKLLPKERNTYGVSKLHIAVCSQLSTEGMELQMNWTRGTERPPDAASSKAFFESLSPWQELAIRFRYVSNILKAIDAHIANKRTIWDKSRRDNGSSSVLNGLRVETEQNSIDAASMKLPSVEWDFTLQKLAELLYTAHGMGRVDLSSLLRKGKLLKAMQKLCENISFTKTQSPDPGKSLYNALLVLFSARPGTGRTDNTLKNLPVFESIVNLVKCLKTN